jgi:hypothetical protein
MARNQGIKSRNLVSKPVRIGAGAKAVRPGGAAQIGVSVGTHVTEKRKETKYRGERVFGGGVMPSKFGNEVATNVGGGGPGKGRVLYGQAGSQGQHGSVNLSGPRIANTRGECPDSKR